MSHFNARPIARALCALAFFLPAGPARAQTSAQQLYLQCLTNFETYAETIWHTNGSGIPDAGYWGDGGSTGNGGIRGNSGIAVAYATLCVALPDDPKFTNRLNRVRQALNYDYSTHVTGSYNTTSLNKWGWSGVSTDWQTPEWSGSMGLACILVQSNLPAATVDGVRRVVVSEADHRAGIAPASGYISDTKAEENAWQGNILALAAAWMSSSNNAATWLAAAKSYLVNTYTVPDTNGDPLAAWVTTQTLYPSYALENHGFYHPTYEMVAGMSSGDSLLMARLANPGVATQLLPYAEHNVLAVWTNNLDNLVMDSGDFAYPAGVDWAVHDFEQNSFITWMAAHFNDPLARWTDGRLAQCVRYHQITNGDGTFVGVSANPGGGILFYREAVEARRTAIAWLHWANADYPTGPTNAPDAVVMTNYDVQVIHQRSAFGSFSVSFDSSRIMALVEPSALSVPTNAFIASPRLPGILGLGALGNPTAATLISLSTNGNGFDCELKLTSSLGTTEEYIKGTGESLAIIEVPTLNNGATPSSGGSFICGIENDPLTGGSRRLEWSGGSATITNRTGAARNVTNNWICAAGRYGLAAGPAGYFRYAAASGYTRTSPSYSEAGEAEDALSFVENNQLAPRYAVWFPAKSALQTSNAAAAIIWVTNNTTATLTFPGAGVAPTTLTALLGVANTNNSGAWAVDAAGNWSDTNNWSGGIVANGVGNLADFSQTFLTADRTVTLDSSRAIGALYFDDISGAHNWTLAGTGGAALTLNNGSSSPLMLVYGTATISAPLAGANGFTKTGFGTLVLSGSNSLSGTLYVDTATSAAVNDGAVCIARSASVANVASPIYLKNNNSGSSTLQFDGSGGDVTVAQNISLAGRNVAVIAIQNLAGSNTLAGNFILTSGGQYYWLDSESGTLALAGQLPSSAPTVPSARTLTFMGAGNFVVSGAINNANGYPVNVVKSDSGMLTLNGTNTYAGLTTVNAGTLAGNGIIAGPMTILPDAILSPGGSALGSLMINNALTNTGTVLIRVAKSGAARTNDAIAGLSVLNCGGTLTVANVGPDPLTAGDSFQLITAANMVGNFAATNLPPLGVGLLWNNRVATDGTLAVVLGAVAPQFASAAAQGTNLVFNGSGGAAWAGYSVLASTNLAVPLTNWSVVATGTFDGVGNFEFTNPVAPGTPRQFFNLRMP